MAYSGSSRLWEAMLRKEQMSRLRDAAMARGALSSTRQAALGATPRHNSRQETLPSDDHSFGDRDFLREIPGQYSPRHHIRTRHQFSAVGTILTSSGPRTSGPSGLPSADHPPWAFANQVRPPPRSCISLCAIFSPPQIACVGASPSLSPCPPVLTRTMHM